MNEIAKLAERIPSPPCGVSVDHRKDAATIHLQMASSPYGIKVAILISWMCTCAVLLTLLESYGDVLSTVVLWIHAQINLPAYVRLGIYLCEYALCILILGLVFRSLCRRFKITIDISASFLVVSALRTRRWSLKEGKSIKIAGMWRQRQGRRQNNVIIEEWGISETERIWLNKVLDELIAIKQA